jgi:dTDP-glucose 4,6-dehydratase
MTILVTGGAGFIGSNFVLDWLAAGGETVVNLDKLTYAGNRENLASLEGNNRHHFVAGGIEDEALTGGLLSRHEVRAVVNFAAESHVDRSISGPGAFIETNVVGTFRLLEAVRGYWSGLPAAEAAEFRFLHVSTDEVYGTLEPDEPPFSENNAYRPNSPYAASKASSDHLVRAYGETYGLPVLITNCSNNYGPYHFPEKLIPLIIHNALSGKRLPVYGDGRQVRDWLYVKDHCSALRTVLAAGRPGETYNVGGGNERANIDVVQSICAILDRLRPRADGASYSTQIAFVKDRPGHDRRYAIDATKLRGELGWRPAESFETGLEKTIRWNLDNPGWVERVTSGAYRTWVEKHYA